MKHIQKYTGKAKITGLVVRGYAARGLECDKTFILVPARGHNVRIVEVDGDNLTPIM